MVVSWDPGSSSWWWLVVDSPRWYFLLLFRLANLCIVRTWFVPDEYFQSVEVAYNQVYGVGHLSWEWQPEHALRSYLHPMIFMLFYWPLKILHLDSNRLINLVPHLVHVVLFALSDYFMLRLLNRIFDARDKQAIRYAFLLYLSNWFVVYCAPRTLSNSLETVLTLVGLNFYPIEEVRLVLKSKNTRPFNRYVICAALACLIRPTSVLIWAPLGIWHLWRSRNWMHVLFGHLLPPAFAVGLLICLLDALMYKHLTIPAWNFIRFNVLSSGSTNFGVNPFYWYLTEGIPPVFTLSVYPLILALAGAARDLYFKQRSVVRQYQRFQPSTNLLLYISVFYVLFHSFIAHKEHRFLLPIVPLVMPNIAATLCKMEGRGRILFWLVFILQIPLALYFGLQHQKAPGELIHYINQKLNTPLQTNSSTLISQLMPCYSMPQYAAIHPHGLYGVQFRMIDCTPQFEKTRQSPKQAFNSNQTQDESDLFHVDPLYFIRLNWKQISHSSMLIAYERPFKQMQAFLRSNGFKETQRFYNTRFPVSDRQDKWVIVAERS